VGADAAVHRASAPATQNFFNAYHLAAPISGPTLTRGDIRATAGGPFAALPPICPSSAGTQRLPRPAQAAASRRTRCSPSEGGRVLKPGRLTFYARYRWSTEFFDGSVSNSPWAASTGTVDQQPQHVASLTNVWSPHFTTQSKAVFNRLETRQC
jgi:hypothetical protein